MDIPQNDIKPRQSDKYHVSLIGDVNQNRRHVKQNWQLEQIYKVSGCSGQVFRLIMTAIGSKEARINSLIFDGRKAHETQAKY
jgi:hypothetical protein